MKCSACSKEISEKRKTGFCKICYARDYRKRNKVKIRPVTHKKYLRNKEKYLKCAKDWRNNNRERIRELHKEEYRRHGAKQRARLLTRRYFNHLKEEGYCEFCGIGNNLEFHHEKPYRFDEFQILCKKCHKELENKKRHKEFLKSESSEVKE